MDGPTDEVSFRGTLHAPEKADWCMEAEKLLILFLHNLKGKS
jgi:hypothetical protein